VNWISLARNSHIFIFGNEIAAWRLVFTCYDIRLDLRQVNRGVGISGVEKEEGAPRDDENDY